MYLRGSVRELYLTLLQLDPCTTPGEQLQPDGSCDKCEIGTAKIPPSTICEECEAGFTTETTGSTVCVRK